MKFQAAFCLTVCIGLMVGCCHPPGSPGLFCHDKPFGLFCHAKPVVQVVPAPGPIPTVDVGGDVASPAQLAVPAGGLSVRRALSLVGGLRSAQQPAIVSSGAFVTEDTLDRLQQNTIEANRLRAMSQAGAVAARRGTIGALTPNERNVLDAQAAQAQGAADAAEAEIPSTYKADPTGGPTSILTAFKTSCVTLGQRKFQSSKAQAEVDRLVTLQAPGAAETLQLLEARRILALAQDTENSEEKAMDSARAKFRTSEPLSSLPVTTTSPNTYLVAIRRAAQPDQTWFFPYETALAGFAGEITLGAGDFVQVLDHKLTSLGNTNASGIGGQYVVQGYVGTPGPNPIKKTLSIASLTANHDVADVDTELSSWTLARPSSSGTGTDIFVLPETTLQNDIGQFRNAKVLDGDIYTFGTIPTVPIVFESIARKVLNGTSSDELRARLLTARTQAEIWKDNHNQRIDEKIAKGGPGTGLLRNLRAAGKTLDLRTGVNPPLK